MSENSLLKFVKYSKLSFWEVKKNLAFKNSFHGGVFLKEILTVYKKTLSKDELIENNWRIIQKINFQGEICVNRLNKKLHLVCLAHL